MDVINTMVKSNSGRRGFRWLTDNSLVRKAKASTQRQELRQGPWRSAAYRLAVCGLLSLLSHTTQDHPSRGGTTHRRLGPPTSVINQEKAPTGMPTGQVDRGISSVEVPSSQTTLTCIKLIQKQKQNKTPNQYTLSQTT